MNLSLAAVLVTLALALPSRAMGAFNVEYVDTLNSVGASSAIAVDAQGVPHIGYRYYVPFQGDVRYAVKLNGQWSIETVIGWASDEGYGIAVALDDKGEPALSYGTGLDVLWTRRGAGTWTTDWVGGAGNMVGSTSLDFDGDGRAHVIYPSEELKQPFHLISATETENGFSRDEIGNIGAYPSAKVEPSGRVHVSCFDQWTGNIHYVSGSAGAWTSEVIEPGGFVSSLDLSASGEPSIVYQGVQGTLRCARKLAGSWVIETVDGPGNFGQGNAIVIDALGRVNVSYYDGSAGDLRYAMRDGASWTIEVIDAAGDVGRYSSIAAGPDGSVHISYYDATGKNLKYAFSSAPTGVMPGRNAVTTLRLWPNPTLDGRVFLALPVASHGEQNVEIYDVSGRQVRSLSFQADAKRLEWDGRDSGGHLVPPGTYLFRYRVGDRIWGARVTLIR